MGELPPKVSDCGGGDNAKRSRKNNRGNHIGCAAVKGAGAGRNYWCSPIPASGLLAGRGGSPAGETLLNRRLLHLWVPPFLPGGCLPAAVVAVACPPSPPHQFVSSLPPPSRRRAAGGGCRSGVRELLLLLLVHLHFAAGHRRLSLVPPPAPPPCAKQQQSAQLRRRITTAHQRRGRRRPAPS